MSYTSIHLEPTITISEIVTIHYFEYGSDFSFDGEAHDFWEFLCVDKGEIEVLAGDRCYTLSRDDIIFHKPNEFHNLTANHSIAPNLVVISFYCDSPAMDFFRDRLLAIDDEERQMLAKIIQEARHTFLEPLNNPYQMQMIKRTDCPIGSQQVILLYLELLLLHLLRRHCDAGWSPQPKEMIRHRLEDEIYHHIIAYMQNNLSRRLTLEQISRETLVGISQLQQLIRTHHGCGVIDLFCRLKIDEAKQLIRNQQLNFTEISEVLGYSSIHYFSRQFKKVTGMTPSEYSSSIKGLSEKPAKRTNVQSE